MAQYNFTQAVASTTWTINHNMDAAGIAIDIIIDNVGTLEKTFPTSTVETDSNTITVTFPSAQSGFARLIEGGEQVTATVSWSADMGNVTFDSGGVYNITEDTFNVSVLFNNDGTKMFIYGANSLTVYQYTLSAAWDITTASYDSVNFDFSGEETGVNGILFNNDGTKMYMLGNVLDSIFQYTLSSAYDLSSMTYDSISFSVGAQDGNPSDLALNSDGTKMYMLGAFSDSVHQYTLSSAYDLNTISYDSVAFSVGTQAGNAFGMAFNTDGTLMYICDVTNSVVYQYDLSSGFVITTSVYNGVNYFVAPPHNGPYDFVFSSDGVKMYTINNVAPAKIAQHSTNI